MTTVLALAGGELLLGPAAVMVALVVGGVLGVTAHRQAASLEAGTALWALWAGVAGGILLLDLLSGELLSQGTGGLLIAGVGSLLGAAGAAEVMGSREAKSDLAVTVRDLSNSAISTSRTGPRPTPPTTVVPFGPLPRRWDLVLAVGGLLVAILGAVLGMGVVAVASLIVAGAVGFGGRTLPLAGALFVVASAVLAGQVLLGVAILSPLGLVGQPVAVVLVTWLTLLPLLLLAAKGRTWRSAVRRLQLLDGAAFVVAGAAAAGWWSVVRGMSGAEVVAQLSRLGEDNHVHLMLLDVTRSFSVAVGSTAASRQAAGSFADYFPGAGVVQSAVGGLMPGVSTPVLYAGTIAGGLALLGLGATALGGVAVTRVAGSDGAAPVLPRIFAAYGAPAALVAMVVGLIGVRLALPMFELGFPGHLLATVWVVVTLAVLLDDPMQGGGWRAGWALAVVVALVPASVWTWSLAAPVLAAPLPALMVLAVRSRRPVSMTLLVRGGLMLCILAGAAVALLRDPIVALLTTLSNDGPVFRAIPIGFSLATIVALPIGLALRRRPVPPGVTALLLTSGAATLLFATWHLMRLGALSYYTWKMQYLVLALGWAGSTLLLCAIADRAERGKVSRALAGVIAVVLAVALVGWPGAGYRSWLQERAVLGADPAVACAVEVPTAASRASFLAVGFGSPLEDYLTTKALIAGAGRETSFAFWGPIIDQAPDELWPWSTARDGVVLVVGPAADPADVAALVAAGEAAGTEVDIVDSCASLESEGPAD